MKWQKLVALATLTIIAFVSCKKSDLQSSTQVLGRWQIESNVINQHYNYQDHETIYYGRNYDYFDFTSNGTVAISYKGYIDYLPYRFSGNRFIIDDEIVEIRSLTNSEMVLSSRKYYSSVEFDENTYYLYRY